MNTSECFTGTISLCSPTDLVFLVLAALAALSTLLALPSLAGLLLEKLIGGPLSRYCDSARMASATLARSSTGRVRGLLPLLVILAFKPSSWRQRRE